jgi:hypothetical protein
MIREQEFERLVRDALGRAGAPAPFSVDVRDRVMSRIAELGPPVRAEVGLRQFVRWAVAASVFGAALLSIAVGHGQGIQSIGAIAGRALADGASAAIKLGAPLSALAGSFGRVGWALLASARTVIQPLTPLQPLARVLLTAVALAMMGTTALIVGRDLLRGVEPKERT